MDRVAPGSERCRDDDLVAQIALTRGRRAQTDRPVGAARGETVAVHVRRADDGLQIELAAGPDDAQRDLTAVGDEHPRDAHADWTRNSGAPYSTSDAFS